jgi:hypothetical protein
MIKNMYVVTISRARGGYECPADAFCYCGGVFAKRKAAFEKIESEVADLLKELRDGLDEEELAEFEASLRVYDNLDNDWHIEVDYEASDGTLVEFYLRTEEVAIEVD